MGALLRLLAIAAAAALVNSPRPAAFSFDPKSGVSNRFLTPNGDGKNDTVVFSYANPRDISVSGTIVDLKGAKVGELQAGAVADTLVWDPRSSGQALPGGVYVYIITGETLVYTGTLVVVR